MSTVEKSNDLSKSNIVYFYDEMVGNFHYGYGHPMKPHRIRMTHDLVQSYGLLDGLKVVEPKPLTFTDFTKFHTDDYIEFLQSVTRRNQQELGDQMQHFNVGEDCPIFDGLYDFCNIYSAGSVGGANILNHNKASIAINWAGGLHHGKKHEASGFCYVNDCVLAALEFLKYHHRVVYVDIDIHHGDGVEEAFYCSDRGMCVSFHKYGDYFPGTGALADIGEGPGHGYSVNVPLRDGVDDDTFIKLFTQVMTLVKERYQPEAVVLQCGADSLSGDRLGCFNLSLKGHGYAVDYMKKWNVPLLLLGGGGYTLRNVPKCWAHETATVLGTTLEDELPQSKYYEYFGPDYSLTVRTSNMENLNDDRYCNSVVQQITENFRNKVSPVGAQIIPSQSPAPDAVDYVTQSAEPSPDVRMPDKDK
ncbi:unnamed protein product [Vitrella brassicaformis CCMP3155]|uniref:Histone deacetylase n=1 Tax=Vitrella brassicaformis (strain CCMP3155) TaxID=1169540 RepID=A0A0G4GAE7_VITBC|nr:unnamed protein product [Vitrella brassicaformis CCMP3155]|mmetsp:Transcript_34049/g.84188  ORF Transcript_34049/g.84188 Transcript_34049/m.84188 type:complete len:417 (-) Transcript_34049:175-1425(-)|eukprot:CEM25931.1 unnamed protein product [Vitrella brassicaformis CCMP3155]